MDRGAVGPIVAEDAAGCAMDAIAHLIKDPQVPARINIGQPFAKEGPDGRLEQVANRKRLVAESSRRAAVDKDPDRLEHLAATERYLAAPAHQGDLVELMAQ